MDNINVDTLPPAHPQQATLFALEELTVNTTGTLGQLLDHAKKLSQMLEDSYLNDPKYRELYQAVENAKTQLDTRKAEIDASGVTRQTANELKSIRSNLAEKKASLSDYALEYERMSGSNTIEIEDELYTIVKTAKLVRTPKKL